MQRNLIAVAVVFGCQEEPDYDGLRAFAVHAHADLEHFVVQTRILNKDTNIVRIELPCKEQMSLVTFIGFSPS